MRRQIAVIGGGPAGLMAARLLARDHSDWEVTVFERLEPDETFGFGVGLTRGLLTGLRSAAPAVHDELLAASNNFSSAAFWLPDGVVELPSYHAGAIGRARMLRIVLDRARQDGVDVRIGSTAMLDEVRGADLVIAADGVSSAIREQLGDELGAEEEVGRGLFIWCGADITLEGTVFMPVHTIDGTFVAHAYPYSPGRSTFVIETDTAALERAGCLTEAFTHDGESDEASLAYLSDAFTELLGGRPFTGNRSRWMRFRTVRCARWHHDNVVLLGDAAATAHPSLGSGTKLALEGAIALAEVMESVGSASPAARLAEFEEALRPNVERLQERARRSQLWWESFPSRLHLSRARIAFAYMSRAGAVSLGRLREIAPALAGRAAAEFAGVSVRDVPAGDLERWVLERPLQCNGMTVPVRTADDPDGGPSLKVDTDDPWSVDGEAIIRRLAVTPPAAVTLTGSDSRSALLDRLALGERIRAEIGARVTVTCVEQQLPDAVDGLVAGRADLVRVGGA